MSTILHHVRHRVEWQDVADYRLAWTRCAIRFCWAFGNQFDIAYHEPATSRCPKCYA